MCKAEDLCIMLNNHELNIDQNIYDFCHKAALRCSKVGVLLYQIPCFHAELQWKDNFLATLTR